MAKSNRVIVVSPSGSTCHLHISKVQELIQKKRVQWIEEGVSAMYVVRQQYVDYSGIFTSRCRWRKVNAWKFPVLQLT